MTRAEVTCRHCGQARPVQLEACAHCGALTSPSTGGQRVAYGIGGEYVLCAACFDAAAEADMTATS